MHHLLNLDFMTETNRLSEWKSKLTRSTLFRNTASMLAGGGIRLCLQAMYFVMIARGLGAKEYGAFIGVVALVAILAPFAPLGTGQILIRNVARDRNAFRFSWGNALWMIGVCGSLLLAAVLLLARAVLAAKIPLGLVFLVGLSDLLLAAMVTLVGQAFQAVELLHRTAQVSIALTTARAIAAVVLIVSIKQPTAVSWAVFYCASSGVGAAYAIGLACSKLGRPALALPWLRSDLMEGFYFSITTSSYSISTNIDKTMLVRLATFDAAGIYAAAYRLIDLAFQPVAALSASAYAKFFQHGLDGLPGTTRYAKRLLPSAVGYSVLAGVLLVLVAPVLPLILGRDFLASVEALRWLSPLAFIRAFYYFLANSLTGANLQGLRSAIQLAVACLNILLNLWLIPAYSWRGAAWASLTSEGALALGMLAAIVVVGRRQALSKAPCSVH